MKKLSTPLLVGLLWSIATPLFAAEKTSEISLAGPWGFALDQKSAGVKALWFKTGLSDTITLPGTTDEAKKGPPNINKGEINTLSRAFPYKGLAWYQKDIEIPSGWKGKRITLFLERTKYTSVWVDAIPYGDQESLVTPHVYDLTSTLTPGRHRLTIAIDNSRIPPISGHEINENTQTNWNGIIGQIALRATDKVWIDSLRIVPDLPNHCVHVRASLGNEDEHFAKGTLALTVQPVGGRARLTQTVAFDRVRSGDTVEATYDLGAEAKRWGEFTPDLYQLTVTVQAKTGDRECADTMRQTFGFRQFSTQGQQFTINGQPVLLRGKLDCCVFPLTGYPPMDVAAWERVFRIAKAYGLNFYRFHTWCPPEAAFVAADRAGVYFQIELPFIGRPLGSYLTAQQFARDEGARILKTYGNHPCFVLMATGNEISGGRENRAAVIQYLRGLDPEMLYAQASNYDYLEPQLAAGDDFWMTMRTKDGLEGNVRGSYAHVNAPLGHIQADIPATTMNYDKAIDDVPVPVIGHEVGQYQVFPDFHELGEFTGPLKPWNYEVFRDRLRDAGMLDQAKAFCQASGALAVICYREDIEAALRTKNFGGFALLDIMDFPGTGTALDGILDVFMNSKGLITPEAWRNFCNSVVPLALMTKRSWTSDETYTAEIKVANYGPQALPSGVVSWRLNGGDGTAVASGELPAKDIPQGTLTKLGTVQIPLNKASAPAKLTLTLAIQGTSFHNDYDIWVYPPKVDTATPPGVSVSRSLDDATMKKLAAGDRVLLLPELDKMPQSVEGFFASDFYCYPMFLRISNTRKLPVAPGTLGLLCDPQNPALAEFPTESHSNWQWFPIVMNSRSLILDGAPRALHPIVQIIDNMARNHKLALVFEAAVGAGRLLVCTSDLPNHLDQPAARQLYASLLHYAASQKFNPSVSLTPEELHRLFAPSSGDNNDASKGYQDDRDAVPLQK